MERLERIEDKIDRIVEIQSEMQIDVANHILRTRIAEENIEKLADRIAPIQHHVALVSGAGKLLTILISIAGVVVAFLAVGR